MPSSPYSSFADRSLLQHHCICSCSVGEEVPSGWPQATCGQKGLFMWAQMDLLTVAALSRHSWPSRLWWWGLLCQQGKFWVLRRSWRGLLRWVCFMTANPRHLDTLHIHTALPFLSSAWLPKTVQVCSNKHRSHGTWKNIVHSLEHLGGKHWSWEG